MKMFKALCTMVVVLGLAIIAPVVNASADTSNTKPIYDLSEWQGTITNSQAQKLKNEANFLILRVQYGSSYKDKVFQNNVKTLSKYGVKYGVYSYSLYSSASNAANEATTLIKSAPNALFYVNDAEANHVTSGSLNSATVAWANRARQLTKRPIVLYSYQSFMSNFTTAKSAYDAIWLASYTSATPNTSYHYDLWQYTDKYYSAALGKRVDASRIPTNGKPLSFWLGGSTTSSTADDSDSDDDDSSSVSTTVDNPVNNPHVIQISPSNYVSTGTRFKVLSKNLNEYKNVSLSEKATQVLHRGQVVSGTPVKYGQTYRIKTADGTYFSANKKLVQIIQ
ncbi:GH25 family lysozyme [Nicoliella lavandulae]|uniref:GH25 family lysozyme n=1 Tax=Nicoliella lavandulae TaxID=3082954 RepID=A0ABU8SIX5_9LACO